MLYLIFLNSRKKSWGDKSSRRGGEEWAEENAAPPVPPLMQPYTWLMAVQPWALLEPGGWMGRLKTKFPFGIKEDGVMSRNRTMVAAE